MLLRLEVIEKIVLSLPLNDLVNCKLVCKAWKEVLSSEQFCRNYTLHYHSFADGERTEFLKDWLTPEGWYCYWSEDESEQWVFKDPPKEWGSRIVHPADLQPEKDPNIKFTDFLIAMTNVTKLQKGAVKFSINCQAWGNESGDGYLHPFIMQWSKDSLPRHDDIFGLFTFHPQMHGGCQTEDLNKDDKEDEDEDDDDDMSWHQLCFYEDGDGAKEFLQFLKKLFSPGVMMCIGCDAMNSVPVFYLAKIAPGWVGGYMSGVTCT